MNFQQSVVKVFVYGTLKPGKSNYHTYCQGKTIAEIPAYTKGLLYHLPLGYPAMTTGQNRIEGYLLHFEREDILSSLDWLENYSETRNFEVNDYYRQQVPIYSLSERFLGQAWCYLMTSKKVAELKGKLLACNSWHS